MTHDRPTWAEVSWNELEITLKALVVLQQKCREYTRITRRERLTSQFVRIRSCGYFLDATLTQLHEDPNYLDAAVAILSAARKLVHEIEYAVIKHLRAQL